MSCRWPAIGLCLLSGINAACNSPCSVQKLRGFSHSAARHYAECLPIHALHPSCPRDRGTLPLDVASWSAADTFEYKGEVSHLLLVVRICPLGKAAAFA